MLLLPVTYEAEARHTWAPIQSLPQVACPRYNRPGMVAFVGQPAVHCSCTWMSERLLPGSSLPPQSDRYVPTPASSSSLLDAVIVHVACCTRWNSPPLYDDVSGEDVGDPAPTFWPLICSSQKK